MSVMSADMMGVDFVARCLAGRKKTNGESKTETYTPVNQMKYKYFVENNTKIKQLSFDPLIQTFRCDLAYYFEGAGRQPVVGTPQRDYNKANIYPSIGIVVTDGNYVIWLLISDRAEGATVINSGTGTLQPAGTVEYLDTTWYVSSAAYASSGTTTTNSISAVYPNTITFSGVMVSESDVKAILDYVNAEVITNE